MERRLRRHTPVITGGDISGSIAAGMSAVYAFSVNGGDAIQVSISATSLATGYKLR